MEWYWVALGVWLVAINVATFFTAGLDKWKAKRKQRDTSIMRVRERTLWTMGLLGGVWGLLLAMRTFRHKTRKGSFRFVTGLIVVLNLVAYAVIAWVAISGRG